MYGSSTFWDINEKTWSMRERDMLYCTEAKSVTAALASALMSRLQYFLVISVKKKKKFTEFMWCDSCQVCLLEIICLYSKKSNELILNLLLDFWWPNKVKVGGFTLHRTFDILILVTFESLILVKALSDHNTAMQATVFIASECICVNFPWLVNMFLTGYYSALHMPNKHTSFFFYVMLLSLSAVSWGLLFHIYYTYDMH